MDVGLSPYVGKRFGRLTVLESWRDRSFSQPRRLCKCACECGNVTTIRATNLQSGNTQSCGCLHMERLKSDHWKHGQSGAHGNKARSSEYRAWDAMKARCLNPKTKRFAYWGGCGITICERWMKFENFFADMGPKPSPKHSLDRWPNPAGNYEPGNCRWATVLEQRHNRRSAEQIRLLLEQHEPGA